MSIPSSTIEQIKDTLKGYVFEINEKGVRGKIIEKVSEILRDIDDLSDLYIVCDDRNNPSSVIENNQLVVDVFYKNPSDPMGFYKWLNYHIYDTNKTTTDEEHTVNNSKLMQTICAVQDLLATLDILDEEVYSVNSPKALDVEYLLEEVPDGINMIRGTLEEYYPNIEEDKPRTQLLTENDVASCVFGLNRTQIQSATEELNKILLNKKG